MRTRAAPLFSGLCLVAGLTASGPNAYADTPPLVYITRESFGIPQSLLGAPPGIRVGNFIFHESLGTGIAYDSNIYATHTDVTSDRILFIRSGITATLVDPNHKLTFRGLIEEISYDRNPSNDRLNAVGEVDGLIRVNRNFAIATYGAAARVTVPRSSVTRRDLPTNAANPVVYNQYDARTAFIYYSSPLTSTTTLSFQNADYFNAHTIEGNPINLQYQDHNVVRVSQEEELRLSHRLRLFSRIELQDFEYYHVDPGQLQQSELRFTTVNGVEVGFTPLMRGLFSFTFTEYHLVDPNLLATPWLDYQFMLSWFPLRQLRLRAGIDRNFGGTSFSLDSIGGRRTRADFEALYQISSHFFARANIVYLHSNESSILQGGKRVEDTIIYRTSLGYELNKNWTVFVDYAFEKRDSTIEENNFHRDVIQIGVAARF